jgi:uncharacterized membrane protein YadS
LVDIAPGLVLSAIVAAICYFAAAYVARVVPIPSMVIALVVGIALNPIATRPATQPGMAFCVRPVLRWAVALLGLRVGLADIAALGVQTGILRSSLRWWRRWRRASSSPAGAGRR